MNIHTYQLLTLCYICFVSYFLLVSLLKYECEFPISRRLTHDSPACISLYRTTIMWSHSGSLVSNQYYYPTHIPVIQISLFVMLTTTVFIRASLFLPKNSSRDTQCLYIIVVMSPSVYSDSQPFVLLFCFCFRLL